MWTFTVKREDVLPGGHRFSMADAFVDADALLDEAVAMRRRAMRKARA